MMDHDNYRSAGSIAINRTGARYERSPHSSAVPSNIDGATARLGISAHKPQQPIEDPDPEPTDPVPVEEPDTPESGPPPGKPKS